VWRREVDAGRDWEAEWDAETRDQLAELIASRLRMLREVAYMPVTLPWLRPDVLEAVEEEERGRALGTELLYRIASALDIPGAAEIRRERTLALEDQIRDFIWRAEDGQTVNGLIRRPGFRAYVRRLTWSLDGRRRPVFVIASIESRRPGLGLEFLRLVQEHSPWEGIVAEQVHTRRVAAWLLHAGWHPVDASGAPVPAEEALYFLWRRPMPA
jgi:hypothetical protein